MVWLVGACIPDDPVAPTTSTAPAAPDNIALENVAVIRLGKQLKNPYSLANMQRALDSMRNRLKNSSDPSIGAFMKPAKRIKIEATDMYVRFLPKDSAEMNRLERDPALELFGYPLDYEILTEGYYYHDPTLPVNSYTWQYTVVKPDYVFPNIRHEVLEQLFIPENSTLYNSEAQSARAGNEVTATQLLPKLETLSLLLTDNLPDKEKERLEQGACLFFCDPPFWNASGSVMVENNSVAPQPPSNNNAPGVSIDYSSYPPNAYTTGRTATSSFDPVKNVKVRMRRWWTVKTTYTSANGYFFYGSVFRHAANYSLEFSNDRVVIKESWFTGLFDVASYEGPKRRDSWNIKFYYSSVGWLWSNIMTGVYDFDKQSKYFLPSVDPLPGPLRIVANQHENIDSYAHMGSKWGFIGQKILNDIRIYKNGKNSQDIYGTIIHELGHALHWKAVGTNMYVGVLGVPAYGPEILEGSWIRIAGVPEEVDWNKRTLLETWATSVELSFVRRAKYPKYKPTQSEKLKDLKKTAYIRTFFDDLRDTLNQQVGYPARPLDRVNDFTLHNMYRALQGADSMRDWRNNLYKIRADNPTRQYLQEYFQQYDSTY